MVSGHYVKTFGDASHVLFDGHLDDPSFRAIAIERIVSVDEDFVTLDKSKKLIIDKQKRGEKVRLSYKCPIFGDRTTQGSPFKDTNTDAINGTEG